MPQDASDSHLDTKISKIHQKTSKKYSSKEAISTKKNVDAVMQDEEEVEREDSRSQEILPSNVSSEKKDGSEGLNIREEENFEGNGDSHVSEEKICHREIEDEEEDEEGTGGEEEAGLDDEAQGDDEEGSEKVMGKRDGIGHSVGEEPEREGDVPEVIPDSEDGEETTEEEERESSFQDEKEARKSQGSVEDDRNVNTSDRDIHKRCIFKFVQVTLFLNIHHSYFYNESSLHWTNTDFLHSLEELNADETKEEEAYNLIEKDEEEDEVVVEKAYPWQPLVDDHTKCPDDDEDDDIEGLLNPVNSQTQK